MSEGRRQRVKDKVRRAGLDALASHEIVELLLYPFIPRKDTSPLARTLLKEFGTLRALFSAKESDLLAVKGMPPNAAFYFSEFTKIVTVLRSENVIKKIITNIEEAMSFFYDLLSLRPTEAVYILCLDIKRKVVEVQKISEGEAAGSDLNLRKIAETAIKTRASYIILGHNHPSGETLPSAEDIAATATAQSFLENIGVGLLDHIIVGKHGCLSMRNEGLMPQTNSNQ